VDRGCNCENKAETTEGYSINDFPSFFQENKSEGGDAVLGANLAPRGPELVLFFWPSHILHGLYK